MPDKRVRAAKPGQGVHSVPTSTIIFPSATVDESRSGIGATVRTMDGFHSRMAGLDWRRRPDPEARGVLGIDEQRRRRG